MKTRLFQLAIACFAFLAINAPATVRYVDLNGTNPVSPFTNWISSATNIQDAVDAASAGDQIFVTNGVYQIGARLSSDGATNRVVVTNALTLQSVNGSTVTVIDGGHAMRCVYLADGAVLAGFAITNGNAGNYFGGGVYCTSTNALVSNCLVISNSSGYGGGVIYGTVSNCILSYNHSTGSGGGAESCILYNCLLSNNSAVGRGGGASAFGPGAVLNNCIVFGNTSAEACGGVFNSTLNNCLIASNACTGFNGCGGALECVLNNCTVVGNRALNGGFGGVAGGSPSTAAKNCIIFYNSPVINGGPIITKCCISLISINGNISNAPVFINMAAGDFHLQSNSPCINAGNNSFVTTTSELDGNPRIVSGTVDIGAYEFQSPVSQISYAWLQQYDLPINTNTDFSDADGDGMNNWQEWRTGTIPTNSSSLLQMMLPAFTNNPSGVTVTWQSVSGVNYFIHRGSDLLAQPAFSTIQSNLVGQANMTTYTDTTATNGGPYFYRVGVQ